MWAILGEPPPLSWNPPEARDEGGFQLAALDAPTDDRQAQELDSPSDAGEKRPPGIWVVERPSLGIGPPHTAIEYVPEKGQREWISAGSSLFEGRLISGVGTLDQKGNPIGERSDDRPQRTTIVGRVTPGEGMTDADQWEVFKSLDAYYKDNVDYDVNPEVQDSYNFNSYTRGLLDAGGATYKVPFDEFVGGNSPLPTRHFVPPHAWEAGFADSLKPKEQPPHFRRLPGTR